MGSASGRQRLELPRQRKRSGDFNHLNRLRWIGKSRCACGIVITDDRWMILSRAGGQGEQHHRKRAHDHTDH
ncbi:hypothetical protein ApDm4_1210 [Acetobacter pomorum]|nr:hypothetical protein ApDm4_1210 [Acetobacter pomorum]